MELALDRMDRLLTHHGEGMMNDFTSMSVAALMFLIIMFVITTELWKFNLTVARINKENNKKSSFSTQLFIFTLPVVLAMLTIRLIGTDLWAGLVGWGEPMIANLAIAGFDQPGADMTYDREKLQDALDFVLSGRAGQTLIPAIVATAFSISALRHHLKEWQITQQVRPGMLIAATFLFMFGPTAINPTLWSAWTGNPQAYADTIVNKTSYPINGDQNEN